MSDPILYINNFAIPYGDVKSFPPLKEEINYDSSSINIPDSYSFELDNTAPTKYDPKYSGSLLHDTKIFGLPISRYNTDLGKTDLRGVIKNVSTDNGVLTIEGTSQLSAISENDVQFVKNGVTPADAIYQMFTSPITFGSTVPMIDPSYIDIASFQFASGVQKTGKCTVNINLVKTGDKTKKYKDVLPELSKIGHCALYSHYDRIYLWQYTPNKNPGIIIDSYITGSYHDGYSTDDAFKVRNSFIVAQKSGTGVAYAYGKDLSSIQQKYGESIFGIPTDTVDSTASNDFNILIDNVAGSQWCGNIGLTRFSKPALLCYFDLEYKYNSIKVGDVVGLNWAPFSSTPVLVLSAEYDKSGNRIKFKCLFL